MAATPEEPTAGKLQAGAGLAGPGAPRELRSVEFRREREATWRAPDGAAHP